MALTFKDELPEPVRKLLSEVYLKGFDLFFVGGIVRDHFITGKMGEDFDVEVVPESKNKADYDKLKTFLKDTYKASEEPFEVMKVNLGESTIDFSLPRKEIFKEGNSHKNFTAEFILNSEPLERVVRRDFTMNAILLNFKDGKVVDPLEGVSAIDNAQLHPCGKDFPRDPVRLLRAFRFYHNLAFSFSNELILQLKNMNPGDTSPFWRKKELQKCRNPLEVLSIMKEFATQYNLNWPMKDFVLSNRMLKPSFENVPRTLWINHELTALKIWNEYLDTKEIFPEIILKLKVDLKELQKQSFEEIKFDQPFLRLKKSLESIEKMKVDENELSTLMNAYQWEMHESTIRKLLQPMDVDYGLVKPEDRSSYKLFAKIQKL